MVTKQQLHEAVLARKDELVSLVSQLIRIPSENPCGEQHTVVAFVKQYLEDMGLTPTLTGPNPEFPCLLAQLGGEEGFSIILNGHLDVVPAGERSGWQFDPFGGEVTETTIRGRGTSDMKAGMAGLLFVVKLLKESGARLNGNIRLHIVSDEESGGEFGTKWLCDNGYANGGNACLVAEPTSNNNIEIGQKGILHMTLRAHGTPAHGSLGNYIGDNAIVKLSKVLVGIDALTAVPGHYAPEQAQALANSKEVARHAIASPNGENAIDHLTANVGVITGGTKINMVPDLCEAQVDMRLPIGIDHNEIIAAVEKLIADAGVTGVEALYEWCGEANYTDYDAALVRAVHRNAESIWGIRILPAYQWASSDAKHYRDLGIPTIQYGPANTGGIHSYNEDVDIEDVVHAAEVYMLSFCDLLGVE